MACKIWQVDYSKPILRTISPRTGICLPVVVVIIIVWLCAVSSLSIFTQPSILYNKNSQTNPLLLPTADHHTSMVKYGSLVIRLFTHIGVCVVASCRLLGFLDDSMFSNNVEVDYDGKECQHKMTFYWQQCGANLLVSLKYQQPAWSIFEIHIVSDSLDSDYGTSFTLNGQHHQHQISNYL